MRPSRTSRIRSTGSRTTSSSLRSRSRSSWCRSWSSRSSWRWDRS